MIICVSEDSLRTIIKRYGRLTQKYPIDLRYDYQNSLNFHYCDLGLYHPESGLEQKINAKLMKEGFASVARDCSGYGRPIDWVDIYFFGDITAKNWSHNLHRSSPQNRTYVITSDPSLKEQADKERVHTVSEQDIESVVQKHFELQQKYGDRQVDISYCGSCSIRGTSQAEIKKAENKKYAQICNRLPGLIQDRGVVVNTAEQRCMGLCGLNPIEIESRAGPTKRYITLSRRLKIENETVFKSDGIDHPTNPLSTILEETMQSLLIPLSEQQKRNSKSKKAKKN